MPRRSLRSRVAREAGATGHRSEPYSVAERPGHRGATRPPEGGPSAVSVQGPGRREPERPGGSRWFDVFLDIKFQRQGKHQLKDVYAFAAIADALRAIEEAMPSASVGQSKLKSESEPPDPECRLGGRRSMAKHRNQQDRVAAIVRSLNSLSLSHAATVPDRQALEQWLRGRVGAVLESAIGNSYFTQLAHELNQGHDPWTVSRRLIGRLPEPDNVAQAERLRGAHCRLVQAMTGNRPQPQVPPRPDSPAAVEPLARESQAPASRRQEIVQRLSSGNRLSVAQVEAFRSAVAEAADTGAIGQSGSRPETWAMGLLERIEQSVDRPIDGLTELEMDRLSSDRKRFGELLENLESAGHL